MKVQGANVNVPTVTVHACQDWRHNSYTGNCERILTDSVKESRIELKFVFVHKTMIETLLFCRRFTIGQPTGQTEWNGIEMSYYYQSWREREVKKVCGRDSARKNY